VPFGDVESLIGKVRLLLDSPDLRQELGENASKLMKRKFDKKVIERAYFDEFASLGLDVMGPSVD
jgi:glycosyltransferase involved in cell wall biosynthesis